MRKKNISSQTRFNLHVSCGNAFLKADRNRAGDFCCQVFCSINWPTKIKLIFEIFVNEEMKTKN